MKNRLYSIQFLHQITTWDVARFRLLGCIVSNFYIKSQHVIVGNLSAPGCIVSNFYIKSQHSQTGTDPRLVVQYPISTSNHNLVHDDGHVGPVVQYPISTSNHNQIVRHNILPVVVQYPISTSNHNTEVIRLISSRLYSIQFLHQITTPYLQIFLQ